LNYKGEEKTIEYSYTYNDKGDVLSDGVSTYQYEYNSRGLITRKIEQSGSIEFEYKYEYDGKDQLIKEAYKSKYSSSVNEYEYDSVGNLIRRKTSNGDVYEYVRNNSGDVVYFKHMIGKEVELEYWCEYTYYNNGKVKEKTTYTHFLN